MSEYIQELMSPQLMGAIYLFVGFIAALCEKCGEDGISYDNWCLA